MNADALDSLAAVLVRVLMTHDRDNSTAGWNGSPNPHDWRNIRRACICGERLVAHDNPTRTEVSPAHRAHVADHLAQAVAADKAEAVRAGRAEALREAAEASVSDDDECIPWDHDHDRATVAVWLLDRAEAEQGGGE